MYCNFESLCLSGVFPLQREEKLSGLNQPHRRLIRLRSILNLRQAVMDAEHQGDLINSETLVEILL